MVVDSTKDDINKPLRQKGARPDCLETTGQQDRFHVAVGKSADEQVRVNAVSCIGACGPLCGTGYITFNVCER